MSVAATEPRGISTLSICRAVVRARAAACCVPSSEACTLRDRRAARAGRPRASFVAQRLGQVAHLLGVEHAALVDPAKHLQRAVARLAPRRRAARAHSSGVRSTGSAGGASLACSIGIGVQRSAGRPVEELARGSRSPRRAAAARCTRSAGAPGSAAPGPRFTAGTPTWSKRATSVQACFTLRVGHAALRRATSRAGGSRAAGPRATGRSPRPTRLALDACARSSAERLLAACASGAKR